VKYFNNSEIFPIIAGNISRFYYVRSIITMNNVTLLLVHFPAFGVTVNIFTLLLEIIHAIT
jgi:hypothetical protein